MKLKTVAVAVLALTSGFAFAQSVVTIAHVGPTSGAIAHLGKDNENGAIMAVEEINAAGLTIGGQKVTLKLMMEDDGADPKQGTAVAQKLADAKVSGVIGHLNSGTTIPASKIYSDAGIPQISPSATNPKYTRQGFKTAFRVVADDTQLGGTLGRYAVNTLKGKTVAVIDDRTAYGQGVAEEFSKAVVAAGGKVAAKEFTTDKATDFNAILTTIKGKKVDVVFFGGMDATAVLGYGIYPHSASNTAGSVVWTDGNDVLLDNYYLTIYNTGDNNTETVATGIVGYAVVQLWPVAQVV